MDARQLRFFLAIIDYGGFSRAADQLLIAQPSLSQAIAGLERELGVPLFHRVGRGVVPSDAAERLIGPARQVLRDLAAAQSAIDAVKGVTTGSVEISSMPSPAVEPLTTIMTAFVRRHPDITLSVASAFEPDEVLHAVRTGEVEIGLLGAPTPVKAAATLRAMSGCFRTKWVMIVVSGSTAGEGMLVISTAPVVMPLTASMADWAAARSRRT